MIWSMILEFFQGFRFRVGCPELSYCFVLGFTLRSWTCGLWFALLGCR